MPSLFLSEEELERYSGDGRVVVEKADAFIKQVYEQLETVKAKADAASITAEQTCSLLEQKYVSLSSEYANLQSHHSQLNSSLDQRLSEIAQLQADKHQIHLQSIGKDGEIERLTMEASELHKSKRQLIELLQHKDLEISEKNTTIKAYLDKIVNLTDGAALREARLSDIEADLARTNASSARLLQEKELIERHNAWLNDELTAKVNSLIELRKTHNEVEADMSAKLEDVEKKYKESSSSLKWKDDRVRDLELKLSSIQEELCSSKDAAAATEERFSAELSTVTKLVELYKESSEEWSKKAGELEGVIKALETHSLQVENDYKERLEKEVSARKEFEKEAASLKQKLEKCETELESARNANEMNLLPVSCSISKQWVDSVEVNDTVKDTHMLVPTIPAGVSGTALAASLLRDGWSLAKMYAKYQEAVDALRHEQLGRKQSQDILERVLYEIEEKAGVILDERAEHERLVEAYSAVNQKLQHSLSEKGTLERTIQELKVDLRKHEQDFSLSQKDIADLQKQVTVLLKECRDIQLRCGSAGHDYASEDMAVPAGQFSAETDAEKVISERLLTFRDINGLVDHNVQLRSLVRSLTNQLDNRDLELKVKFEEELCRQSDEAASKVNAVLARAEEQGRMLESLHTSVAMYKKLYEEEHRLRSSYPQSQDTAPEEGRKGVMLLLEGTQDNAKKAQEQASARVKCLEEDQAKLRSEVISLRSERDKLALEANFAQEKFDRFMKEYEHQRDETNGVIARNVEFSQLIIDYQRKMREFSESSHAAEELARKLTMEVSILKHEKEMLVNSEKRACDEVRSLSERVHRLQATLDTIQSTEEVREEARGREIRKKEEYLTQIERELDEVKKELQEERCNVRSQTLERENAVKSAMRQVEEMGKELAKALHAVTAAGARASAAEARCADLEKKIKSSEAKVFEKDEECGPSSSLTDEGVADLHTAKEEIEKLREEAQVNKDHMLQYKSIAQVNESALKQIEAAHENFKVEADRVKKSLEAELSLLREQVNELESDCNLKTKEAASAIAGQEEALAASLSEISSLKDKLSVKTSQIVVLETQNSAIRDDLEKEHQRWRNAQANYERQVILQSETIQELTKTSQALSSMQVEASELRKSTELLKSENKELKASWETEKSILDEAKSEAEKKYNEINEQNKILHSRLEALHIKLAETERVSGGTSSGSTGQDLFDDAGLQNVVNYLRRSKEIAETEISLLKQEKHRLQSQLESALKAAETAQASLRAERANSRASLFTEEEFKSLQFQVREINLLRESNVQLREENEHNFNECQRLREAAQNARNEIEKLGNMLAERETEVEACKKEIEIQKMKSEFLEKRVDELIERCKNIDVEDYDRMIRDFQQMQVNMREKDAQVDEIKKLVSEKREVISRLEQDLARNRMELNEREARINDVLQLEASLKADVEKQKKLIAQFKKKSDVLLKEKEDLSKENQALSKQLDEHRQGKRITEAVGEQAMREKEKEKDTRIQMLEKTVERLREELRKDKDDHKIEKTKRLKIQKTISDSYETVTQGKTKLVDELEKHKQALKTLSDEVEKLKNSKGGQPEGTSVVQLLSGTLLDDLAAAYHLAVENFERVAHPIFSEIGAHTPTPPPDSSAMDTSSLGATTDHGVPVLAPPSVLYAVGPATSSLPSAKIAEERERKVVLPKANVETRKAGRKLIRPRIARLEEPHADTEMSDIDGLGKTLPPFESHGVTTQQPSGARKRQSVSSSTSELQEESPETIFDVAAPPLLKKSKGSQDPQEEGSGAESQTVEIPGILPAAIEDTVDDIVGDSSSLQGVKDEAVDEVENTAVGEQEAEEAKADSQVDMQNDGGDVVEESLDSRQNEMVVVMTTDDQTPEQDIQQQLMTESGSSEREEGELVPDVAADVEGGGAANVSGGPEIGEVQPENVAVAVAVAAAPSGVDEEPVIAAPVIMEIGEINSPQVLEDDKNDGGDVVEETVVEGCSDKLNDGSNDQVAVDTTTTDQQVQEIAAGTVERASSSSGSVPPGTPVTPPPAAAAAAEADTEVKQQQQGVGKNSTTINLHERARQRSLLRQAGVLSQSPSRGRGRAPRGRATRGGRGGRGGQAPSE
ncbi:hypothetical protein LguiB_035835 [Lonicera macranthoides]